MKYYNKETRNESVEFYRTGDWGLERPDKWENSNGNFTNISPPDISLREKDPVPCDWNEEESVWVVDLEILKDEKTNEITQKAEDIINSYTSKYSQIERDSWGIQLREAKVFSVDNTMSTPFLDGMVEGGAKNKQELVSAILTKNAGFSAILSNVLGQRVGKTDEIKKIVQNTDLSIAEKVDLIENFNIDIEVIK
ncbi:MAG: hypothetical protein GY714_33005 [Desulfobacterales bacterium]|nr:hypothetical protein [Desulfobacterales bacterium]MCP4163641.1 hypothetical protein [Deltaproteobacteria bacterium]